MNKDSIFNQIYEREYVLLVKIAYRVTYDRVVSEELCQEAFIRYYERMDSLPTGDEARYWLIRVVKNLALNYEKRRYRESKANRRFLQQPQPQARNDGERKILEDEARDAVKKALRELPPKLRMTLVLKEYGGLNYKEIGRIMKISEGNVKIRVFRAREQLNRLLGGKGEVHVP